MRARAPGKLVISGAYAVLEGAPAIVTAVNRYVLADSAIAAPMITPEVQCALGCRPAPWFDASALRSNNGKLGLGSSAAIVVASLAAIELDKAPELAPEQLAERLFPLALRAHRQAQGGGSGIDVLASAYGGTRVARIEGENLRSRPINLPNGQMTVTVYASGIPSSTSKMLAGVRGWAKRDAAAYYQLMSELCQAAREAVIASEPSAFVLSLRRQAVLLATLGDRAGVPIVPHSLRPVANAAWEDRVVVLPSGAGGGDVVLAVGAPNLCQKWHKPLTDVGAERVELEVGSPGVHAIR